MIKPNLKQELEIIKRLYGRKQMEIETNHVMKYMHNLESIVSE